MKALFYTTQTVDCANHVRAWNSCFPAAEHMTYNHIGIRNDHLMLEAARNMRPDVVFWIGAHMGSGNPRSETFKKVRDIAPLVNLCSDAGDWPWHEVLRIYKKRGCFDLQVSIDGAKSAPVDLATLTPIDDVPFSALKNLKNRDIRCGFSGTVGRWNSRSEVVLALEWFGNLTVRRRVDEDNYEEHVQFLSRCQMLLNFSHTGTGQRHHVKGRVLEAGWSGCALLESKGSPVWHWFPADCYIMYGNPKEAAQIISDMGAKQIHEMAANLAYQVRQRYTAKQIYTEILEQAGVDITK